MARYSGVIGFGISKEISPGVWDDEIVERKYYGDVVWNHVQYDPSQNVNNNIRPNNSVSVLADAFANKYFADIRYLSWHGKRWTVSNVEVDHPRLKLFIGQVYNGPTPGTT